MRRSRITLVLAVALIVGGCAGARLAPLTGQLRSVSAFAFETDTFAFPNFIQARHPDEPDLYAHYCFVLARAVRQFHVGARFDPAMPKLTAAEYVARVRAVAARPPRLGPLPASERVVIPGYANLRAFSSAEEQAVKEGLGGRFWTWVHWTNWRVTLPVTRSHQERVAREIVDELATGRLVQLLVTNWPKPELNHTVVAYAAHDTAGGVDLLVWDPNDPAAPGIVTFDLDAGQFFATRVYETEPGPIRAFRMYYSRLL
jgi:hypothetical protein